MVKPFRALGLLLLVNGLLLGFIFLVPSGVLPLFNDLSLHFISQEELLTPPKPVELKDVTQYVAAAEALAADSAKEAQLMTQRLASPDTARLGSRGFDTTTLKDLENIDFRIEYDEANKRALHDFFANLDALSISRGLVRIMHFGDSQVEGDRITGTLRNKLQLQFGGCGAGTVPIVDVSDYRSSIRVKGGPEWKKFAIYGNLYKGVKTRLYGTQGAIFRFAPFSDSSHFSSDRLKASISINRSREAYPNTFKFQDLKLYYGQSPATTRVTMRYGGRVLFTDSLPPEPGFAIKSWPLDSFNKEIKLEFAAGSSPNFYGIGFDCKAGLVVDNISMRGSSGIDFNHLDLNYLAEQLQKMNTKLLILQYGVNVVPGMQSNYDFFEKSFYKTLKRLRDGLPGVSILVVGVSDVAMLKNGQRVSYPNIPLIRDAQKRAAFKAGCAFWDLYQAMGGENSMAAYVEAKPSLAEKDYTHFNARGARLVGTMLYKALMREYLEYKENAGN